jgi:hypothetical protein
VEKKVSLLVKEQDGTSAVRPFEPMSEEEEP